MTTPGSNTLIRALRIQGQQTVAWYEFTGRSTNDYGEDVSAYGDPIEIKGSLQPVPRNLYDQMGLDLQKNYVNFFCPKALLDLRRDVSGDLILFSEKLYKVESLTGWFQIDGWVQALAVQTTLDELPEPDEA